MNIDSWLARTQHDLQAAGIATARLDALILLEDALGKDRTQLLAHPEWEVPAVALTVLKKHLERRGRHEPLAYVRGKVEFYGREFIVSPAVLVPRPESEAMIELLVAAVQRLGEAHVQGRSLRIADVGTGSGALGITAALELPNATVELLEIDEAAISIAKMNVIKHTTDVLAYQSDLLPKDSAYDVLLCNLPYVPEGYTVNKAAEHEPALALYAGEDGLDLYRRLFTQLEIARHRPLLLLLELFPDQHSELEALSAAIGYTLQSTQGFIKLFGAIGRYPAGPQA